jgi:hypothetical protein
MEKLLLLKEFIGYLAEDELLFFLGGNSREKKLQQELRRLAWLIEDADCDQIKTQINIRKQG